MTEITLNGHAYRLGTLDAFKQLHLSRKLAPLIPELVPAFVKIQALIGPAPVDGAEAPADAPKLDLDKVADIAVLLGPFADALAGLSDADTEYITALCMSVVHRQSANTWAAVWNKDAKTFMFQDIGLDTLMVLLLRVIQANLGNFIRGFLTSPDPAPAET